MRVYCVVSIVLAGGRPAVEYPCHATLIHECASCLLRRRRRKIIPDILLAGGRQEDCDVIFYPPSH